MKKIGFVDFYLSEWHANNYPQWIKEAGEKTNEDYVVAYAFAEENVSPVDGVTSEEWCKEKGIELCGSIAELCEKSDFVMILSPDNCEKHLSYAKEVFPHKKPTYIDKTFAPDLKTAKEIFRLSEEYSCPFFSSSSLRFAPELVEFEGVRDPIVFGNGKNFFEYIIHTAEIASVLLQSPVKRVKTECMGIRKICRIQTENGNEGLILQSPGLGFAAAGTLTSGKNKMVPITSNFFFELVCAVVNFFDTGVLPVKKEETLEVMRLREAVLLGEKTPEKWIDLEF